MFFVASLVSVPVGPTSVHLVLSTLMGFVLGWAMVPAVFVGLLLQAVLFGFGGLTSLGVTTCTIALPGLVWATLLRGSVAQARTSMTGGALAAVAAVLAIATSALIVVSVLGLSDSSYLASAPLVVATYAPLAKRPQLSRPMSSRLR